MREAFDRRVVPEDALALVRACQRRVPAHLAGGARPRSGCHQQQSGVGLQRPEDPMKRLFVSAIMNIEQGRRRAET